MRRCWWGCQREKRCSSTACRIYRLLQPLGTPAQWGRRQHGCTAAPGKAGAPPHQKVWSVRPYQRDTAHLPHKRRHDAVLSALCGFASGTAACCSSTGLSKCSFTSPCKQTCDFEVTTVVMEQAQKSSNFPGPRELSPASCPQAFPAPHRSLRLKHRFCHWICSSYRGSYSTATVPLEPHLALTQKLKHQPRSQALRSVGAVSIWLLPCSLWPWQTDGEAAPPPAARALAGFSPTPSA